MKEEFMTQLQRARKAAHDMVISKYIELRSDTSNNGVSDNAIFRRIINTPGMPVTTAASVRNILIKANIYQYKRK